MIRWLRNLLLAVVLACGLTPSAQAQDLWMNVPGGSGGAPESLGSWIYLGSQTASASATLDFPLTSYSGYTHFVFVLHHLTPATDATNLWIRTSSDGGSTYDSAASNYRWATHAFTTSAGNAAQGSAAATEIILNDNGNTIGNLSGEGFTGEVWLVRPSAALETRLDWRGQYRRASDSLYFGISGSGMRAASADVDAVRFLASTGNLGSGTIDLYGLSLTSTPGPNEQITKLHVNQITATPSTDQNDFNPSGWDGTEPDKATHIRIGNTASIRITGLAGGTEGRIAILTNVTSGTSGELLILEDENASSTAANRFAFSDGMARFLMPGASIQLIYDSTSSRWRQSAGTRGEDRFDVWEDLNGTGVETGTAVSGTGASCQTGTFLATDTTDAPLGVLQCDSGTTATGRAHVGNASTDNIQPAKGPALFLTRATVETLSVNASEEFQVWAGWHDAVGKTSPTDGVYWQYDVDVDTTWRPCTEDTSTQVCSTTDGPTVSVSEYHWLGIFCPSDWIGCTFFHSTTGASWTISGTVASENPPEVGDEVGLGVTINKTTGTTQRNLSVDLLAYRYDYDRGS
jgi:hypothetical protein